MFNVINILLALWVIRTVRAVLFWIYLWQLKEYHVGRFIDHFRTHKGKELIFNKLQGIKLVLLAGLLFNFYNFALWGLIAVYAFEIALLAIRRFKKPVWTFKTIFLMVVSLVIAGYFGFLYQNLIALLIFDLLASLIVSAIVLLVQPVFVLMRNRILQQARDKMATRKDLIVIGITGSYGKTSTKEFLTTILASKFKVLSTPEHKNSEIGIAQTILNDLKPEHKVFVVEMGSYNKGGIKLLCGIAKPKIGIVTGVNEQHLATFGSMENLLSAEGGGELLTNLPLGGTLVVNGDNKYCRDLYKKAQREFHGSAKLYSVQKNAVDADAWTQELSVHKESLDFVVMDKEKHAVHFNVSLLGSHNVQNMLAAILTAQTLGMSLEEIAAASKNIRQEQAGIVLKEGIHGIQVIDSSYSTNPTGVMADLDYLNIFSAKGGSASGGEGKKVLVMPCLIELGQKSVEIHQKIGRKIAEVCDMAIITTKDKFEEIKKGAVEAGANEKKIVYCHNPKEIFHLITTFCSGGRAAENPRSLSPDEIEDSRSDRSDRDKEGDTVLLEGRVPGELIKLMGK